MEESEITEKVTDTKFLHNPGAIRRNLVDAIEQATHLDIAVAFVNPAWSDVIGSSPKNVRLVCWLKSTNTDPYAVEQMMLNGIKVRQIDSMHAKVYICKGASPRCIVGSANLSKAALSEDNISGQYEAAIAVCNRETIQKITRWFSGLWKEAMPITSSDLRTAKVSWKKAHANRPRERGRKTSSSMSPSDSSFLPPNWIVPQELADIASQVRNVNLSQEFAMYQDILQRVAASGNRNDLQELISMIADWTRHAGAYYPALSETPVRVRNAFKTLFDRGRPVEDRLSDLSAGARYKLHGFALPSLTTILYWRYPSECPPFNRRTQRFLADFGLDSLLPKTLSPNQYDKWITLAQELSARLSLPSAGHVDRLVWEYTRDLEI